MARKLKKKQTQVKKIVKQARTVKAKAADQVESRSFSIPNTEYFEGTGRRKVATARVRVYAKPGDYVVNNQLVSEYFATVPLAPAKYNKALQLLDLQGKHAITVKVSGSGIAAQLDAVLHGMARALVKMNVDYKPVLKEAGLLTRDDRMKETRKIGMGGKARRKRQSPKR